MRAKHIRAPNIVLVIADQHRGDCTGASGNVQVRTPNIDSLAKQGAAFESAYVQSPVCMPSRASIMTGCYPSSLGLTAMATPLPEDVLTLAHVLRSSGYETGVVGKLHFLAHANRDHSVPHPKYGFDSLHVSEEPGCYDDFYRAWVRARAPEHVKAVNLGLPPAARAWQETMGTLRRDEPRRPTTGSREFPAPAELTHSAFVAEQVEHYIEAHLDSPFFLVVGFFWPHEPWTVPKEFLDLYEPSELSLLCEDGQNRTIEELALARASQHGYYAAISEVDYHLGRILAALEERHLDSSTIVVYTSDHGEFLGQHSRYGKGYPAPDCVSQVPLIMRGPGVPKGERFQETVELIDLMPTLLSLVGVPVPRVVQGRPLPGTMRNHQEGLGPRAGALTEGVSDGIGWRSLRTEDFRYVLRADGLEELYEMSTDPGCYESLTGRSGYEVTLSFHRLALAQRMLAATHDRGRTWPY